MRHFSALIILFACLFLTSEFTFANFEDYFDENEALYQEPPWSKTLIDYGAANLYSSKAKAVADVRLKKQIEPLKEECESSQGVFTEKLMGAKYNQCCINSPSSRPCFRESSYPYPNDKGSCTAKITKSAICSSP